MPPPLPPPNVLVSENLSRWLRACLIAEIFMALASVPLAVGSEMLVQDKFPDVETGFAIVDGGDTLVGAIVLLGLTLVPAIIASWIGLFLRKPWAPWLYLGIRVAALILNSLIGLITIELTWGVFHVFSGTQDALSGVVLALIFLTPLRDEFRE